MHANYERADLPELVKNNCTNLCPSDQAKLLEVLEEFEDLFDGNFAIIPSHRTIVPSCRHTIKLAIKHCDIVPSSNLAIKPCTIVPSYCTNVPLLQLAIIT